jgi:hypothetical protein
LAPAALSGLVEISTNPKTAVIPQQFFYVLFFVSIFSLKELELPHYYGEVPKLFLFFLYLVFSFSVPFVLVGESWNFVIACGIKTICVKSWIIFRKHLRKIYNHFRKNGWVSFVAHIV